MKQILAYDLGTSGVKASLYDDNGKLLAARYGQYPTFYPAEGYHEQRPLDWWENIRKATREIDTQFGLSDVGAIGISGHSLGTVAVDRKGNLLTETTPIWSDTRAVAQAENFFKKVDYQSWYETTGNGFPRHLYALFKQMWIKEQLPKVYDKTACFLGSKDYINLRLTGKIITDRSYASGSGAYSLQEEQYIEDYLQAAGIDLDKLPQVVSSTEVIGEVSEEAAKELGLPSGIPVVAGGVDNACMTLGANCKKIGDGYASLGTSAWVTVCAETPSVNFAAKTYTFAHCIPGQYLPSAGIFSSGSSLEWVIHNLFGNLAEAENVYERLSEMVRRTPAGAHGLYFIPNLAGGSSFDPSPDVRGLLAGLDLRHTQDDVVRAVYEGIALHLRCAYDVLAKETPLKEKLLLVGGGARSQVWREIYAAVFGIPVQKTEVVQDAASLGAAALAAVGAGIWKDYTVLDKAHGAGTLTSPKQEEANFYRGMLPRYKSLWGLTQNMAEIMKEERSDE